MGLGEAAASWWKVHGGWSLDDPRLPGGAAFGNGQQLPLGASCPGPFTVRQVAGPTSTRRSFWTRGKVRGKALREARGATWIGQHELRQLGEGHPEPRLRYSCSQNHEWSDAYCKRGCHFWFCGHPGTPWENQRLLVSRTLFPRSKSTREEKKKKRSSSKRSIQGA